MVRLCMLVEETIVGIFLIPQILFIVCLLAVTLSFSFCLFQRLLKIVWKRNQPELNSIMLYRTMVLYLQHLSPVACSDNTPEYSCSQSTVFVEQLFLLIANHWVTIC